MQISLLQWNIWYKEDIRSVARFLREHPADVICLQELTIQRTPEVGHGPDYIAKQLGFYYAYKEIDLGEGKMPMANGIFSRYPIVNTNWQWVNTPTGTGHYDDEYRAYIEAMIEIDGKRITVATTHLSYTNHFVHTARKAQETNNLAAILHTKQQNYILTGDFNATPDSPTIQKISGILHNVGPDLTEPTWTTKPFSYDGFDETQLRWRLDYIFATPEVQVVQAQILQTDYSDHLPIMAHIAF